ncbi:MAG TPA: YvcK family protein [Anaerolineales bacterium]|nr:YvcK family protein [Anaerolineales bacterium]
MIPILLGLTLLAVGLAVIILDFYRNAPETWWLPAITFLSLRFLPRLLRALIFASIGGALIGVGLWGLNRTILAPFLKPGKPVVDTLQTHRRRGKGPRMVAIGGGHGLSTLLRGLKAYTYNLTAVVTVADDGGSSGRLRKEMGILPPGDIRNCLAALSDDEDLIVQLFRYRFANGDGGLNGHSFGNLFISALSDITGSFEEAVAESGRVLSVHGRVLPATLHDVNLVADIKLPHAVNEIRVEGESHIPEASGQVTRVWLEPDSPPAFPEVVRELLRAELILIGPGSLYTSILPNLLVPDLAEAIRASEALKIYICNLATQPGETDGYTASDHVSVLEDHIGPDLFDIVLVNSKFVGDLPLGADWVLAGEDLDEEYAVYRSDVADSEVPWRHDPAKLSQVVMDLLQERTGPLIE